MSAIATAGGLVVFPVAAGGIGAATAAWRRPGPRVTSAVQHFAAGVVLAAMAGEVLPDLRQRGHLPEVVAGFAAGVVLLLALGAWSRGRENDDDGDLSGHGDTSNATSVAGIGSTVPVEPTAGAPAPPVRAAMRAGAAALPVGMLVAVGIDLFVDGTLVGLGATLGSKQGVILTIALTLEILFLAVSVCIELLDAGQPRLRAALTCTALGLATAAGAVGSALLLGDAGPSVIVTVLAFGAAALLYLVVEELLVEAHEQAETAMLSAAFFAGFLMLFVLAEKGG